ncbi:wax ester synthase/diacylglycerol acyltransferase 6-like [Bidens hawaiensis]|uniref:wax ester synthase/diacylglycerol acyltransferase 6-like n=1 Tax=Bidens hawaiensis TaxID=980011 RepID=UPI00404AD6B3
MESLTKGLKWRQSSLKPIQITKRNTITNDNGIDDDDDGAYMIATGEEQPLSPAARLFHEPDFNIYVVAIMGSKYPINPRVAYEKLPQTLLKHPRFSSVQVICKLIVTTRKRVLPASLLLACTRQVNNPDAVPTVPRKKDSNSGWFSSLSYDRGGPWWKRWFMMVCMVFWLIWNTLVDVGYILATALFLKDTETPITPRAGVEHNPKRFVYRTVSLDDMKLIKNAMNMTINDVAVGMTQAGLSQYLNRRYGEGKKDLGATEKKNNLPKKKIRLRSNLLVNIRPSSGIQALADMMEKNTEAKWGNWIGYVILPLTIGIRDNPLDYVREANATINRKKHSLEALFSFSVAALVFKLFGVKAANTMSHMAIGHTTLGFSNLVGPQEEIRFYGHDMEFLAPSCYGHPHSLMINFQSYVNKMTIVLSVDETAIPDPHKLLDDFETSLKLIKEAVYAKGLAEEDMSKAAST